MKNISPQKSNSLIIDICKSGEQQYRRHCNKEQY